MSIISTPEGYKYPWYIKLFFWKQKREYGVILEPTRLWGRSPKIFTTLPMLYGAFDRGSSPLEPALRTLVTIRVSQINGCLFCVDINSATALKRGVVDEKLSTLADYGTSDFYSDKEKAVLAYADAVTYSDRQPTEAHFEALRRHLDDDAIIELTGLISLQNMSSKFSASLGVKSQGFYAVATQPVMEKQKEEMRDGAA